jgi:hypothetical protein
MTTSGKGIDNGSITARLVGLISNMPIQAQKILLTKLEEKLGMNKRKHPRKPYLKEVEFATKDRGYQEFIQADCLLKPVRLWQLDKRLHLFYRFRIMSDRLRLLVKLSGPHSRGLA